MIEVGNWAIRLGIESELAENQNPFHAYVLHFSTIFILLQHSSCKHVFSSRMDPD